LQQEVKSQQYQGIIILPSRFSGGGKKNCCGVAGEDSNSVPTTDTEAENKRQEGLISKTTDSQAQRDQNTSIKRKELQQQELEDSRKCRDKKEEKIVEREKTPNAKLMHTPAMSPTATPQKESLCVSFDST
jgi:hypothetical protein